MHTYSNWGCKRHLRQNKWDHFSEEEYKSYRLEQSNLTDSWHMEKAHQTLEKRFAVLSFDFLKMKGQSLGKCNLGQYCCNSESYIVTLPRGVSLMSYCNVKPYCNVWVSQMNKMRTLHGKLNKQGEEYLKIMFVVNPFYAVIREDCHSCRACTSQPTDMLTWKWKSKRWKLHWTGI